MFKIIVAFILFFAFAKSNAKKKGSWKTPSTFLLGIYTVSIFASVLCILALHEDLVCENIYWRPAVILTLFLLGFLFPFKFFNESRPSSIYLPNRKVLDVASVVLIILSIYAIIYFLPTVRFIFASDDLRELRMSNVEDGAIVEHGIFNTIASVSSSLYIFNILLFFIYYIIGQSKRRCVLLLISSFSNIVHVLAYVGRDGIVFWLFSFVFCYLLFRDYLSGNKRKQIKKYAILAFGIMLVPFALITASRFKSAPWNAVLSYLGQSFINGTLYLGLPDPPRSPGGSFDWICSIIGYHRPPGAGKWMMGGTCSWVFGTFVKSWYSCFGMVGLIIFCVCLGGIFVLTFYNIKQSFPFYAFFIYLLYFQVFSSGVFYFCQATRGGNLYCLLCFVFYFFFKFLTKSEGGFYLYKCSD